MRADTIDSAGHSVETLMFTQFTPGNVTRDMVRPSHEGKNWRIEDAGAAPASLAGWGLSAELPGFHKVIELKRRLGESRAAGQMVFSDGLAAISIFVEPVEKSTRKEGAGSSGATHVLVKRRGDFWITLLGEVPQTTLQQFAAAIEYKPSR